MARRTIQCEVLARVEGEGSLYLLIEDGKIADAQLKIFEPPRFYEAFLRGRDFREAPDITARICGICPIAYQNSACAAMEQACGITLPPTLRDLRRLIYCGEWVESHTLHIYMLHAPDFFGLPSAIELAKANKPVVERGLRLKKIGNKLMEVLGGREIHPVNTKVGGFYRAPSRGELTALLPDLEWAREAALETVKLVAGFEFPDFDQDYEFVALRHPTIDEYPFNEGRLVSTAGLDIDIAEFEQHFTEQHVKHSNALHCVKGTDGNGTAYMVGPQARYTLNFDRLTPSAQQAARDAGLGETCTNPFKSIIVRAVEVLYAVEEAQRIINAYTEPAVSAIECAPRAGTGFGCTEAPRGICWHRYTIDDAGLITDARIVPPTSQNQKRIEQDLVEFAGARTHLDDERLQWQCEQAIRNYDPCISCATHFLDLRVERRATGGATS